MGASRSRVRSRIVFGVLGALVLVLLVGLVAPSLSMPSAVHVDGLEPVTDPPSAKVVPDRQSGAPATDPRAPDASGDNGVTTSVATPGNASLVRRRDALPPVKTLTPTTNLNTPPTFVGALEVLTATPSPRTTVSAETPTTVRVVPTTAPAPEPTTIAPTTTTPTTAPDTSTTVPTTPTTRKRHHHPGLLSWLLS